MNRVAIIAVAVVAVLSIISGGAYWFAEMIRRDERAKTVENTVKKIEQMEKRNVEIRKLDMPAFCRELELDFLPDTNECG